MISRAKTRRGLVAAVVVAAVTLGTAPAAWAVHEQQVDITTVNLSTADLVFSEHSGLLYVSVPSRSSAIPNTLAWIDPGTGIVEGWIPIGLDPGPMAVSADGTVVYVGLNASGEVRAFDVTSETAGPGFSVGEEPGIEPGEPGTPYVARDIDVLPDDPDAVAVLSQLQGSTGPNLLAIYDDGVKLADDLPRVPNVVLEFGSSSSDLFGFAHQRSDALFQRYVVDDDGVRLVSEAEHVLPRFRSPIDIEYDSGRMYATSGKVFDPYTLVEFGFFFHRAGPLYRGINLIEPHDAAGVTYVIEDSEILGIPVDFEIYDNDTFGRISEFPIRDSQGQPGSLVRAGDMLAYRTSAGQVLIIRLPQPVIDVRIDVQPHTESMINFESSGLVTVVVFGSEELDVDTVAFDSVRFGVLGHEVPPHHSGRGVMASHVRDFDRDSHDDLITHFMLEGTGIEPDIGEACVTGSTVESAVFAGCDQIEVWSRPQPSPPQMSPPISGGADTAQVGVDVDAAGYAAATGLLFLSTVLTTRRLFVTRREGRHIRVSGDGTD